MKKQLNFNKVEFITIASSNDFTKYQKEINDMLTKITETVSQSKTYTNIFGDNTIMLEHIKKYISTYFFLLLGLYQPSISLFVNKYIDFVRNQQEFDFESDDFFNSDSTNFIIETTKLISYVRDIKKKKQIKNDQIAKSASEFIEKNNIGLSENNEMYHFIVKAAIIELLYHTTGKSQIAELINVSGDDSEYIYIDIVVPKNKNTDVLTILSYLPEEIKKQYYGEIVEFISSDNSEELLTYDEKILRLVNSKSIVPIVQDFMLYNKQNEKYIINPLNKKDTKIKYIIDKINKVKNLFNKNEKLQSNTFIETLRHRRAVAVNDSEDLNIISKSDNFNIQSDIKLYYLDLKSYRRYPYINFNEIENGNGFQMYPNKTLNVVRDITLNYVDKSDLYDYIESRTVIEGDIINVVGFFISGGVNDLQCIKSKKLVNVRDINLKNGNITSNDLLTKINFDQEKSDKGYYWFFDLEKDRLKTQTFNIVDFTDKTLVTKLMISDFYESIKLRIEEAIRNKVSTILKSFPLTIEKLEAIIEYYENYFFPMPRNSSFYSLLLSEVLAASNVLIKKYVEKIVPKKNMHTQILLPSMKEKVKDTTIKIYMNEKITKKKIEVESYEAICQHFYDWNIVTKSKYDNTEDSFENKLYNFISSYIIYNEKTSDSICKSCGIVVPIVSYTEGGKYSSNGTFVLDSSSLYIPLNKMKKYERFSEKFINELDFVLYKLTNIYKFNYYNGDSRNIKLRRESLLKEVIDFIDNDNIFVLKRKYETRISKLKDNYGITPSRSSLIYFDLNDSLYSEEKNEKNNIMQNVVTTYMSVLLLINIDEEQISEIKNSNDKICTTAFFTKFKGKLFEGLKIIVDNKYTKHNILKYEALCYIIFCFTCLITKYKLWKSSEAEDKKYSFTNQIQAINTIVDIINNLMEMYCMKNQKKLLTDNTSYKRILEKFVFKLNTIYTDPKIMEKILNSGNYESKEIVIMANYAKGMNTFEVDDLFKLRDYNLSPQSFRNIVRTQINNLFFFNNDIRYNIDNTTNCIDGNFHSFKNEGIYLVCTNCSERLDVLVFKKELTKLIEKKCDSNMSSYIYSQINYGNESPEKEKGIVQAFLDEKRKIIKEESLFIERKRSDEIKKNDGKNKIGEALKKKYGKTPSSFETLKTYVDAFITKLENIIGKELKINEEYYFRNDIIIIEHRFDGIKLSAPEYIYDSPKQVKYHVHHPFFKIPVLQIDLSSKNISLFFTKTKTIIGYKKQNEELTRSEVLFKYKVIQSLFNRILYLGIEYQYVEDTEDKINDIESCISTRILNIRGIIPEIYGYLFKILNNYFEFYKQKEAEDITEYDVIIKNEKKIYDKYYEGFNKEKIITKNEEDKFMIGWKKVIDYSYENESDTPKEYIFSNDTSLVVEDIINNDVQGNFMLTYIIDNIQKLIDININTSQKLVMSCMIDIISNNYSKFNNDNIKTDIRIDRFIEILNNPIYVYDVLNSKAKKSKIINEDGSITYTHINQIGDNYEDDILAEDNSIETKAENYDTQEMLDAIDMDGKPRYDLD